MADDDLKKRALRHGLHYVETAALCLTRKKSGRGFLYLNAKGHVIRNETVLTRIRSLVIPPAWTDVSIAKDPRAHIQAIGRDAEGRLQYRYHNDWTAVRDKVKAERLIRFGKSLPKIRARIARDLARRRTDLRYTAATATRLIDRALLRSGHTGDEEGGRGTTTLLNNDVKLNGTTVTLDFTGKSGKEIRKVIHDPILLARLRKLKKPGRKRLFAFPDRNGRRHRLSARELNAYLRDAAGRSVTAKDFRTFAASAHALDTLSRTELPESDAGRKRVIAAVMREVADELVNTPAVTRSSYVHPLVVEAFESDELKRSVLFGTPRSGLDPAETALMRFLEGTLGKDAAGIA